ncbi:MAG: proline--tRNA ligase, partial [Mycoplasmataceae bacterium]|nr:proline--tRNA ligase [Mycoplasmataceae bacterium]
TTSKSYQYLYTSGFLRSAGEGLKVFMPLGWRVIEKISHIIKEEMEEIEGQEMLMPFIVPFKYIENSGRADLFNKELAIFKNRDGKFYALSPAQEEAMVEQVKKTITNCNELPILLYQFQSKYRDVNTKKEDFLTPREFYLHDSYSFHLSYTGLNNFLPKIFSAYSKIFQRCSVKYISAEAGTGFMGGEKAFEFLAPFETGNETVIECNKCGYTANKEIAKGIKKSIYSSPLPIKKVKVKIKDKHSFDEISDVLQIKTAQIAKSKLYRVQHGFVMAVVRADYEISRGKLSHFIKDTVVREANKMEIDAFNLIDGFYSPIDLDDKVQVIIDDTIANTANLAMGANLKNHFYINTNFGVDFESDKVADIAMLKEEDLCNQCGAPLKETKSLVIGKIFKLSNLYSKKLKLSIKNEKERNVFLHMGSYRIDIYRLLASIVSFNSDDKGLIWPEAVAPYKYYLMGIGDSLAVKRELGLLYKDLKSECLFDDRKVSASIKFKDADLIGIPYRIVVSEKLMSQNKLEIKNRRTEQIFEIDVINVKKTLEKLKENEYFSQY